MLPLAGQGRASPAWRSKGAGAALCTSTCLCAKLLVTPPAGTTRRGMAHKAASYHGRRGYPSGWRRRASSAQEPSCRPLPQTQTRAFDTEAAGSSYATGFVVDKKRGIILTNRHVTTPGAWACAADSEAFWEALGLPRVALLWARREAHWMGSN